MLGIDGGYLPAALFAFALTMIACLIIERSLSPEERRLIAESQSPLWHPINENVRRKLMSKYDNTQISVVSMAVSSAVIGVIVFVLGILPGRHSLEFKDPAVILPIAAGAAVISFVFLLLRKGRGASWLDIDETATYTVIPVHHCYDVTHYSRNRMRSLSSNSFDSSFFRTWITRYLVFYQPDGRYVLRIPENTGECVAVILVSCHGSVTWMPVSSNNPEEFI